MRAQTLYKLAQNEAVKPHFNATIIRIYSGMTYGETDIFVNLCFKILGETYARETDSKSLTRVAIGYRHLQ